MGSYQYRVYGLRVDSEIEIPDLLSDSEGPSQVKIRSGEVPAELPGHHFKGVFYQAKKDDFIFNMPQVGAFRVCRGNEIITMPLTDTKPDLMRVFLMGSVFGALLHQKGILALHGSAVTGKKGAILFTGRSSSGKSTLAAVLTEKGFPFITDDISALHHHKEGYYIHPGIPHMKLWKDVINKLGINEDFNQVRPSIEKYRRIVKQGFSHLPEKVNTIITLGAKNTNGIEIRELSGIEKFETLKENTYRYEFIPAMQISDQHFRSISELANTVNVFQVQRPSSPLRIDELADVLIDKIINSGL